MKTMYKRDLELDKNWTALITRLEKMIGKKPKDLNSVLFLIGIQELGKGKKYFNKEEKQDLMHIGTCKILSLSGYYQLEGLDEDGWPHWKNIEKVPNLSLQEQERFLKMHVIEYFDKEIFN
jgi:hypothetical protein